LEGDGGRMGHSDGRDGREAGHMKLDLNKE
jgi:hypothetical protein